MISAFLNVTILTTILVYVEVVVERNINRTRTKFANDQKKYCRRASGAIGVKNKRISHSNSPSQSLSLFSAKIGIKMVSVIRLI